MQKREIAIYVLVGISSILMVSYVVHMFIGGLVSEETETNVTLVVMGIWTALIVWMGWDIARRRRRR